MPKILVLDAHAAIRKYFKDLFRQEPDCEVDSARTAREGMARVHAFAPDVVVLAVDLPEEGGMRTLMRIMVERPTPVVMVAPAAAPDAPALLEALALGAVDHLLVPPAAPAAGAPDSTDPQQAVRHKIRGAARSRVSARVPPAAPAAPAAPATAGAEAPAVRAPRSGSAVGSAPDSDPPGLVLIGVSTGGPKVLERVLPQLPARFPWPVVVLQHMPAQFTGPFADRLDRMCALDVQEARQDTPLQRGKIYIAKGGCDAIVARRSERVCIGPAPADPARFWHPSVDLAVASAMRVFPPRALIGVMLTGMGYDGAEAMSELRRLGGRTLAESEDSAVVWGMPGELVRRSGASQVAHHSEIATILNRWLGVATVASRVHANANNQGM